MKFINWRFKKNIYNPYLFIFIYFMFYYSKHKQKNAFICQIALKIY